MSFDRCPDELLLAILRHLPAVDLAGGIQTANRRFHRLANDPKIWHHHCWTGFAYWNDTERTLLKTALSNRSFDQPWKKMWLRRKHGEAVCARHFDQIVASKVHRNYHMSVICSQQLDAKDFLQREYRAADLQAFRELEAGDLGMPPPNTGMDNCLARRYYANLAIGSINRSLAIEEWIQVREQANPYNRLDRALAAFDMFSLIDAGADMDHVTALLDKLAYAFVTEHTNQLESMTVREKSARLLDWLRRYNLVGMLNAGDRYRDLRNCLLGQALTDHPDHPSLPLISSAIFACIGQRIGLRSYCVAIPGHVHATVLAEPGMSVDGTPLEERGKNAPPQTLDNEGRIYYDPYRTSHEISLPQLRQSISQLTMATAMAAPVHLAGPGQGNGQAPHVVSAAAGVADEFGAADIEEDETAAPVAPSSLAIMLSENDIYLVPTPTYAMVLRLTLNIEASWAYSMHVDPELSRRVKQLHRKIPVVHYSDPAQAERRYRCGSDGDPHADMANMTYAGAWASTLMRTAKSPEWEPHLDRLLSRFAHEFNEDAWIIEKYLLSIHDEYIHDSVATDPQGRHARGQPIPIPFGNPAGRQHANVWTHLRKLLKMVNNLDCRQPLVIRRYTQEICERVHYKVGQVIRHRRFGFIGIIDGWTTEDPGDLPGTGMINDDAPMDAPPEGDDMEDATLPPNARKNTYYSVMLTVIERRIVAQYNVEIVKDPRQIPPELMFLAGKLFKRFDYATCTFVSNIEEFYPDG